MYVAINNFRKELAITSIFIIILFISLTFITSGIGSLNKFSAMGPSPLPPAVVYRPSSNSYREYHEEQQKLILTPPLFEVVEACPNGCIYYNGCVDEGECITEGYICKNHKFIESCENNFCEYECETPESCPEDCEFKIFFYGYNIDDEKYYVGWTSDHYKYPDKPSKTTKQEIYLYELYENEFEMNFKNGNREIISSFIENETITENIKLILKVDSTNCMIAVKSLLGKEGEILKYYKNTGVVILETPWYLVDDISKVSCVREVYPDNIILPELDISTIKTKTKEVWNSLDYYEHCYDVTIGLGTYEECITLFPYINEVKGEGIEIAFVDSGIDETHRDFEDKISVIKNIRDDSTDVSDGYGHGTHIASIALGTGEYSNKYKGNAPESEAWVIKIMDDGGYTMLSYMLEGLHFSSDPNDDDDCSDHVDVLSLSFGYNIASDGSTIDSLTVQEIIDCGTVVVKSAGNVGNYGYNTITSPGDIQDIITVGATDKEDNVYSKSSMGPVDNRLLKPDLVAPGVSIIAALAHDSRYSESTSREIYDSVYINSTGTSMAAPQVAGAAALILSENKELTNAQIKSKLMLSATPLGNSVFKEGAGKLNTLKALHCPIATYPQNAFFRSPEIGDSETFRIQNLGRDILEIHIRAAPIYSDSDWEITNTTIEISPQTFYLQRDEIKEFEMSFTNVSDDNWQSGRLQVIVRPYGEGGSDSYTIPFGIKN